jgi:hypothetical protein
MWVLIVLSVAGGGAGAAGVTVQPIAFATESACIAAQVWISGHNYVQDVQCFPRGDNMEGGRDG